MIPVPKKALENFINTVFTTKINPVDSIVHEMSRERSNSSLKDK